IAPTIKGGNVRKGNIITIAGFLVSIVLLYFALRDIKFDEITKTLERANPFLIPVPLIFIMTTVGLSSFRWARLTGSGVGFRNTFAALMIGLFVNDVLP